MTSALNFRGGRPHRGGLRGSAKHVGSERARSSTTKSSGSDDDGNVLSDEGPDYAFQSKRKLHFHGESFHDYLHLDIRKGNRITIYTAGDTTISRDGAKKLCKALKDFTKHGNFVNRKHLSDLSSRGT